MLQSKVSEVRAVLIFVDEQCDALASAINSLGHLHNAHCTLQCINEGPPLQGNGMLAPYLHETVSNLKSMWTDFAKNSERTLHPRVRTALEEIPEPAKQSVLSRLRATKRTFSWWALPEEGNRDLSAWHSVL